MYGDIFFVQEDSEESESSTDTIDGDTLEEDPGRTSPISLDETDIDTLPDAKVDKNVVRTKVNISQILQYWSHSNFAIN